MVLVCVMVRFEVFDGEVCSVCDGEVVVCDGEVVVCDGVVCSVCDGEVEVCVMVRYVVCVMVRL